MGMLETRELIYFVALAEERHFGRAADRVGIAQPPLSRAIKQLERRLGVDLLDRGCRGVTLTAAGEVLYREAKEILDAVTSATRRTQRAAQSTPTLRLALKPGGDSGLLQDILSALEHEPGAIPVELHICAIGEQTSLIRDGDADVALMHPQSGAERDLAGIDVIELLTERQVVVLPRGHRLAKRSFVQMADLAGETMPRWPGESADTTPGPEIRDAGQLMQLIAVGRTLAVLPESVRWHLRHDLVCVPVLDAQDRVLVAAWRAGSRSAAVSAFVRAATAVADRSRHKIAAVE
jgi:DNA-binding transcriptional LysR family regulator